MARNPINQNIKVFYLLLWDLCRSNQRGIQWDHKMVKMETNMNHEISYGGYKHNKVLHLHKILKI